MAMKLRFASVAAIGLLALVSGGSSAAADITTGVWLRADGLAQVRVQPCGQALCAVNVWIKNPGDEKVGDRLVLNVKPVKPGLMEGAPSIRSATCGSPARSPIPTRP